VTPRAVRAVRAAAPAAAGRLAAVLLGAASAAWAAAPLRHTGPADAALALSVICVWLGALRLAVGWIPRPADEFLASAPVRAWMSFQDLLRTSRADVSRGRAGGSRSA
jgi:hypothetical protein